ncbi:helix-turn-helix domain-containing protein [Aequorivita sp. KMM 9714]|uniref:helix-turn-helix domain-containing protein n=1 Tax=Aequorivita sp. KMM 9714 TaxID=2707173 RepID=UPI0013ED6849|nr:helix-turn-helix domain-containing protein [Aequorivita sp. KMM 9714]NGX83109.1 helix-turn-helix domain-containing protein [Aequorivita sp. KMM 9714]
MNKDKVYNRDFKGIWLPLNILTNKELTTSEILVLSIILHLDNDKGCFATNKYFAQVLNLSRGRISKIINNLLSKGFINCYVDQSMGNYRIININTSVLKELHPIAENINTSITKDLHPIVVKSKHYRKDYKKEYKKDERELTHFDFLNINFLEEIKNLKRKYNLPPAEWNFCINKFNQKDFKDVNIISFENYLSNWSKSLEKINGKKQDTNPVYLRRLS